MWNDDYDYDALNYLEGRCIDNVYDDGRQCWRDEEEDEEE